MGMSGRQVAAALRRLGVTWACASALGVGPAPVSAQGGPPPEVRTAVDAVVAMLSRSGDAATRSFVAEVLDPAFRATRSADEWVAYLQDLRAAVGTASGGIGVDADEEGLLIDMEGAAARVRLALVPGTSRISRLEVAQAPGPVGEDEQASVSARLRAVESLVEGDQARTVFLDEHVTPALRASRDAASWGALFDAIGRAVAGATDIISDVADEGYRLLFRGGTDLDVTVGIEDGPPFRIASLTTSTDLAPMPGHDEPPLAWGSLDARLRAYVDEGFSGTVLALRGADTVLLAGYGAADRGAGRSNGPSTIYGIGSAPLDFTRAAVLLAVQRGLMSLDDPVTTVFPDVPADKRTMTFRHLFEGHSGLPQFHHTTADADADLAWIDREEAERRILGARLLHAPGQGDSPSHSAYVLLSAALERVTGSSYPDFLRQNFLEPLGMTSTGFYGERAGHADEDFAVGYGQASVGATNIPPYWGPTSWLIMGSGGMFSTVGDMYRFFQGLRNGRILQGAALNAYLSRGAVRGGSDRGFEYVHAWTQGDDMIFMLGNANRGPVPMRALPRLLLELVAGGGGD